MKIGLISTAYSIPTPPPTFGGMERINWWLARQLIQEGHDVTLFGCKGSSLEGGQVVELPGGGEVFPLDPNEPQEYPPFFDFVMNWILSHEPFDIIHDSTHHHEFSRRVNGIKTIATIHNPNPPESGNSVYLSNFHRNHLNHPESPYVMNGAPDLTYWPDDKKEDFVLFMGALGLHKGFDIAVRFAVDNEVPMKIAGHPMSNQEKEILDKAITYPWIRYLGTIGGREKLEALSKAKAVIMPFRWPEPGCILAIEAMASGTPIIASDAGVLPEYVVDGQTGFLGCSKPEQIYEAYSKLPSISPSACYDRFLKHFLIERVSNEYQSLYNRVVNGESW